MDAAALVIALLAMILTGVAWWFPRRPRVSDPWSVQTREAGQVVVLCNESGVTVYDVKIDAPWPFAHDRVDGPRSVVAAGHLVAFRPMIEDGAERTVAVTWALRSGGKRRSWSCRV